MTSEAFLTRLREAGIPTSVVIFEDSIRDGCCVRKIHYRWEVCYRERGNESEALGFPSEAEALLWRYEKLIQR